MKRIVRATAEGTFSTIEVEAKITTNGVLSRGEVEQIANDLRDRLLPALTNVRHNNVRLSKVKVQ